MFGTACFALLPPYNRTLHLHMHAAHIASVLIGTDQLLCCAMLCAVPCHVVLFVVL
jgi:hypothetical protein